MKHVNLQVGRTEYEGHFARLHVLLTDATGLVVTNPPLMAARR